MWQTMASTTPTDGDARNRTPRDLQLTVEIEYSECCPLSNVGERVRDLEVQRNDQGCKVDYLVDFHDEAGAYRIEHRSVDHESEPSTSAACVCEIFHEYDCLPHVMAVNKNSVVVATYPPDRESASELVADLETASNSVRLLRLHAADGTGLCHFKEVDLSRLSQKQREAVERANASDFFEPGGATNLEELADDAGISASAYSQRLSRAKTEIFRQLFGT